MSKQSNKNKLNYNEIMNRRTENLLKSNKPLIGIDVGSSYIKMVQIKNKKIVKEGMKAIPEGLMNQGRVLETSQLSRLIKEIMKENGISGDQCSLCVSGNEIIVREVKLPEMTEEQLSENIKHEITSYLPIKQEEYCIDYKVLEYLHPQDGQVGKIRTVVAAAPLSLIQPYLDALKQANLKPAYIDVGPNIVGKLAKQMAYGNAGNVGFIDFGASSTNFTVTKNGNYILHKSISNGGDYLTSQVAKKFNIDTLEAEALKKRTNFFDNNYQNGENLFVENYMNYLIMDIERTIDFFKSRNNQVSLDVLYISGGGSLLKGLTGFLKAHLNIEIIPISDVLGQYRKDARSSEDMVFYAQAIGTTLREE